MVILTIPPCLIVHVLFTMESPTLYFMATPESNSGYPGLYLSAPRKKAPNYIAWSLRVFLGGTALLGVGAAGAKANHDTLVDRSDAKPQTLRVFVDDDILNRALFSGGCSSWDIVANNAGGPGEVRAVSELQDAAGEMAARFVSGPLPVGRSEIKIGNEKGDVVVCDGKYTLYVYAERRVGDEVVTSENPVITPIQTGTSIGELLP